jgi:hypothetical protein
MGGGEKMRGWREEGEGGGGAQYHHVATRYAEVFSLKRGPTKTTSVQG